jgi:hypothetical protein
MRTSGFLILLLTIITGLNFTYRPASLAGQNVVVAELFTSEGCSSCPAADAMLKEMTDIMEKENKSVIGLAFHITYWDHLGWKDPYGQQEFTTRQKKYCEVLEVPSVYTPQMVVNGEFEFVGSNPFFFRQRVEEVLAVPARYQLEANATLDNNEVSVAYSLNKKPRNEVLNIALIQIAVANNVSRGENKNKTLKHNNIVRKFDTTELLETGEWKIALPPDLDPGNSALVLYIQHRKTLKVLGATRVNLK